MLEPEFPNASRDVVSGAFGGILSYLSLQTGSLPATVGYAVAGVFSIVAVAAFYRALNSRHSFIQMLKGRYYGYKLRRKQHDWSKNRSS